MCWNGRPIPFLTKEELEERHARRKQEVARAETIVLGPMQKILADQGLDAQSVVRYGHVTETLCEIAKEFNATQIVVGRMGQSGLTARLFGSVAGTLAQAAPVPLHHRPIMPGGKHMKKLTFATLLALLAAGRATGQYRRDD